MVQRFPRFFPARASGIPSGCACAGLRLQFLKQFPHAGQLFAQVLAKLFLTALHVVQSGQNAEKTQKDEQHEGKHDRPPHGRLQRPPKSTDNAANNRNQAAASAARSGKFAVCPLSVRVGVPDRMSIISVCRHRGKELV